MPLAFEMSVNVPFAVVAEQLVRRVELGQVQIGPAVVVDVAHRDAHAVAAGVDAALRGDVGEVQPPGAIGLDAQIVPVEPIRQRRAAARGGRRRAERLTLHQIHVQVAVLVVVEERDAGRQHLGHVELTRHAVDVDEVEAGFPGAIHEPVRSGRRRRVFMWRAAGARRETERCEKDQQPHTMVAAPARWPASALRASARLSGSSRGLSSPPRGRR